MFPEAGGNFRRKDSTEATMLKADRMVCAHTQWPINQSHSGATSAHVINHVHTLLYVQRFYVLEWSPPLDFLLTWNSSAKPRFDGHCSF